MKTETLEELKSLNKKSEGIALRLRSFYTWMKGSLKASEPGPLPYRFFLEEKRWQQAIAGYLTGTILVEMGVINSRQLAEALQRQREFTEKGKRKSLGVLLAEMGYTTSQKYLDALSRYFRLPVISLLKFIPSPTVQGLLVDRYARHYKLLVLADYGPDEVTLALAEPDPLLMEELKKVFKNRKKINFYLANPFEMERCYRLYLDPYCANFCR